MMMAAMQHAAEVNPAARSDQTPATPIKTSTGKKDLKLYGSLNELNPYTSS
jgi:hypothetical protein